MDDISPDLKEIYNSLRSKLSTHLAEVKAIVEQGRKIKDNVSNLFLFKGMFKDLKPHYEECNNLFQQLVEFSSSNELNIFPTEHDNNSIKTARRYYYEACAIYEEHMNPTPLATSNMSHPNTITIDESRIIQSKLPPIRIGTFDGNPKHWCLWRDTFLSLIHNESTLTNYAKFHYLVSSLSGPALAIIKSVNFLPGNYNQAWDLLMAQYNNKRMIAWNYLKSVLDYKPPPGPPTATTLSNFISTVVESIASLQRLEIEDLEDFLLFSLALRCVDPTTRKEFERLYRDNEFPSYHNLVEFVRTEWRTLDLISDLSKQEGCYSQKSSKFNSTPKKSFQNSFKPKTSLFVGKQHHGSPPATPQIANSTQGKSTGGFQIKCPACLISHQLYQCIKFRDAPLNEKLTILENYLGCRNCLALGHTVKYCKSKGSCKTCSERHHTWLHSIETKNDHNDQKPPPSAEDKTGVALGGISGQGEVILGTATINIMDSQGNPCFIRAVTDSGSQFSFITSSCAAKLGLKRRSFSSQISGIGQSPVLGATGCVPCIITPLRGSKKLHTDAIEVPAITGPLPHSTIPIEDRKHYSSFQLADPTFWQPGPIEFLIGADLYFDILTGPPITVTPHIPKVLPTVLGDLIVGRASTINKFSASCSLLVSSVTDLRDIMTKFWEVEEIPAKPFLSEEEKLCEEHFIRTHNRLDSGRYMLALPFKSSIQSLLNTRKQAMSRFLNLELKLNKDPILREEYNYFMREYLSLGHMRLATAPSSYIIPHHPVFKMVDGQPKLRVVFDASCKDNTGSSLNNNLLVGPKLQKDISVLLLNFRRHHVAFSADIIKMFRQIQIQQEDRKYFHILWRFSSDDEIKVYELCTVTYGTSCAPYQANRTLVQLNIDEGHAFPLASRALEEDIYVDDFLSGACSTSEALQLIEELKRLLGKGCFQLSKWSSNSQDILNATHENQDQEPVSFNRDDLLVVKILGMQWMPAEDNFTYSIVTPSLPFTKRGILSAIARIFDPLGYLSPLVFLCKCILKMVWLEKCDWDDLVPSDIRNMWTSVLSRLQVLSNIRIPRCITLPTPCSYHIIGFCDASAKGYAACLYLKAWTEDDCAIHLLKAKSKLAPMKLMTIPRLELSGALLLARLYKTCRSLITKLNINTATFFTDSTITLFWLAKEQNLLKTFVAHRVVEILSHTELCQWRHISTAENPADCASRGLFPDELLNHTLWWNGPSWLALPDNEWPQPIAGLPYLPSEVLELKDNSSSSLISTEPNLFHKFIERFSSYLRLLRTVAYMFRFIKHAQKLPTSFGIITITISELKHANLVCIKLIQSFYLFDGLPPQKVISTNKRLIQLSAFIDEVGIVRVGGRLRHSSLSYDTKFPILLPGKCHFTTILINHYHRSYLHAGPSTLQSLLQTRYWIISGRTIIRKQVRACVRCTRLNVRPRPQFMGDLPFYRLQEGQVFSHVGVDFGGPFLIRASLRRKAALEKAYLCLFICLSSKAVHLEVVSKCSTEAFLASFDRFVSRRGKPSHMYSDGGRNFIGAANHLREIQIWLRDKEAQSVIHNHASAQEIEWSFNPPYAPHFGGIWEAAIKSAKALLKRNVGDISLTFEELSTVFCKAEAILNSRPLCPLSTDPESFSALTPGHLLIGRPVMGLPEDSILEERISPLKRFRIIQQRCQHFWNRWRNEYLNILQQRSRWLRKDRNFQKGDLVIVKDSNSSPMSWPLARVVDTHPGPDNLVRVVTIKTSSGVFKRPIINLIPLIYPEPSDK